MRQTPLDREQVVYLQSANQALSRVGRVKVQLVSKRDRAAVLVQLDMYTIHAISFPVYTTFEPAKGITSSAITPCARLTICGLRQ